MSFKSLLQEPLLPEGCVDSSCNCSDGQKLLPGVSFRVVRFLSWCQIVLCSAGIVFLLLDWHQPCPTHSSSTHSSAGRLINWRPMLGRKAGLAGLGAHLSCIRGPSQSLVLTLNAAKACLLVLDVAGLALAVSLLQLCRAKSKGAICHSAAPGAAPNTPLHVACGACDDTVLGLSCARSPTMKRSLCHSQYMCKE
jgi:hypothetical protein